MTSRGPSEQRWQVTRIVVIVVICMLNLTSIAGEAATALRIEPDMQLHNFSLGDHFQLLQVREDQTFDLEDAREAQEKGLFQSMAGRSSNMGMTRGIFWLYIALDNQDEPGREVVIEMRHKFTDFATFHLINDAGTISLKQGDHVPRSEKRSPYLSPIARFEMSSGLNEVFIRVQSTGTMNLNTFIWDATEFRDFSQSEYIWFGIVAGVYLVMFFYNFFLYVSFKSRAYLYYLFYILTFGTSLLALSGMGMIWLPDGLDEWMMNAGFLTVSQISMVCSALFTLNFLNMRSHMPRIYKYFRYYVGLLILGVFLVMVVPHDIRAKIVNACVLSLTLTLIYCGIVAYRRGYRPALFYTIAWSSLLFGATYMGLSYAALVPDNFFSRWGSIVGGAAEITLMSLALADRVNFVRTKAENKIRDLNEQLQEHIVKVEEIVAQRTETIARIVNNVKSGFFTVNPALQLEDGFTKSCKELISKNMQAGQGIAELFPCSESQKDQLEMALTQVFEDLIPEAASLNQIPPRLQLGSRYLKLEGSVIRTASGEVESILFTVTDVTDLQQKDEEAARNGMLLKIVHNHGAFQSFMLFVKDGITGLQAKTQEPRYFESLKMFLHTLKGNSLVFGMQEAADAIHQLEEHYQRDSVLLEVEVIFKSFLHQHQSLLGMDWDTLHVKHYHFSDTHVEDLKSLLEVSHPSPSTIVKAQEWLDNITSPSVSDVLGPIHEDVERLARNLGKPARFEFTGCDIRVRGRELYDVLKVMIHLIRNALIHGLEEDRDQLGKSEVGLVRLDVQEAADHFLVILEDDGQGFDLDQIRKQLSDEETDERLDLAGLLREQAVAGSSSAREVTIYAGRGIGLGAIFDVIEQTNSEISVNSEAGKGTRFEIKVPRTKGLSLAS